MRIKWGNVGKVLVTLLLFSCSVVCDSLRPHGLHHNKIPCPSLSPGVCSNSCPWSYIFCNPLLLLPLIFPSIRVFSHESALRMRWPKYWSFSCHISPSNEYSGLIFFRIYWFYLLAFQGTLKSLLQHHNLRASVLRHSLLWSNSHIHTWLLEKA